MNETRCKAMVRGGDGWHTFHSQCQRKATRDGYCAQHHPEAKAARRAASEAKYALERKQFRLQRDIDRAKEAVIEAAKEWYRESDGNDAIVVDALTMAVERLFELEAVKL